MDTVTVSHPLVTRWVSNCYLKGQLNHNSQVTLRNSVEVNSFLLENSSMIGLLTMFDAVGVLNEELF